MKIKTLTGRFHHGLPTLVCVHSSASSGFQWQKLAECANGYFNVIAHNLLGYADAPRSTPMTTLSDQVRHLHDVIRPIAGPVHLVGHSFGGTVALHYALKSACLLSSLTVFEPIGLDLLFGPDAPADLAGELSQLGNKVKCRVRRGELAAAAKVFIDYWNGKNTWKNLPVSAQSRLLLRMPTVAWEFQSALSEFPDRDEYTRQYLPVQILFGSTSPEPARWMAQSLGQLLPRSVSRECHGLDHGGPVTSPQVVNPLILDFADSSCGIQRGIRWAA